MLMKGAMETDTKMWGGNDDISRECQKEEQTDGFSKSNTIAWVNLRIKGNRSGQRGKEEEMASDKETESNNNGRGRKREREREKCCHSSVMDEESQQCKLFSFQSNPIHSSSSHGVWYCRAGWDQTQWDKHSKESWESLEEGHEKCLKCLAANEERQNLNKATLQFMMWQLQHL